MFELSVAFKYLIPRWRQLSVSIISIISILVIALVVWLIVVFFSVVNGLEKNWVGKLIALTAPVRVTPTDDYYNSYYYQVDSISAKSNYATKSLNEKLLSDHSDPYDPSIDEELPRGWPLPDRNPDGTVKDLVKLAQQGIHGISGVPGLKARPYEMTVGNLRLRLIRDGAEAAFLPQFEPAKNQSFLSQTAYIGSFDPENPALSQAMLPMTMADISNLYGMLGLASDDSQEESPDSVKRSEKDQVVKRLQDFFHAVTVKELKTPAYGWVLPKALYPAAARFRAIAVDRGNHMIRIVVPQSARDWLAVENKLEQEGYKTHVIHLDFANGKATAVFQNNTSKEVGVGTPIIIDGQLALPATVDATSIANASQPRDVLFNVKFKLQDLPIAGIIPYGNLQIANADLKQTYDAADTRHPLWAYAVKSPDGTSQIVLPAVADIGEGILLPRSFREAGNMLGDRGFLGYFTPTASSVQEQRIPIFVAGFYDPGIIPIGGKYILANADITTLIRGSHNQEDKVLSNGFNVRFDKLAQAEQVKRAIQEAYKAEGIDRYWKVETYREFEFTRDLLQQLGSEQNLFTLISIVIIIVACSNIISMLIILVNDKKLEIGILRSMGASSVSIAAIFGICGVIMGVLGSLIGTAAAIITLKNLQSLIGLISWFQGYEMFNPLWYGDTLPSEISFEALSFVLISTVLISLLAGIVPATKASLMKPSAILRSE